MLFSLHLVLPDHSSSRVLQLNLSFACAVS